LSAGEPDGAPNAAGAQRRSQKFRLIQRRQQQESGAVLIG
jgi:hypothetical protein